MGTARWGCGIFGNGFPEILLGNEFFGSLRGQMGGCGIFGNEFPGIPLGKEFLGPSVGSLRGWRWSEEGLRGGIISGFGENPFFCGGNPGKKTPGNPPASPKSHFLPQNPIFCPKIVACGAVLGRTPSSSFNPVEASLFLGFHFRSWFEILILEHL